MAVAARGYTTRYFQDSKTQIIQINETVRLNMKKSYFLKHPLILP
jgi:hypothetical protein